MKLVHLIAIALDDVDFNMYDVYKTEHGITKEHLVSVHEPTAKK